MKRHVMLSLEDDIADALKELAYQQRSTVSALVTEAVRPLLQAEAPKGPPASGKRTKNEEAALWAYEQLLEEFKERPDIRKGDKWFTTREIARRAGLFPSLALAALRGLEKRGDLACADDMPEVTFPDGPPVPHWCRLDDGAKRVRDAVASGRLVLPVKDG